MKIALVMLAQRDLSFFLNIGTYIKKNYSIVIYNLYEQHDSILEKSNISFRSLGKELKKNSKINFETKINNKIFNAALLHESLTFNISKNDLSDKYINYLKIFEDWIKKDNVTHLVQEFGGFIAPLSLFNACINNKIEHIFIEPGYIKNTILLSANTIFPQLDLKKFKEFNLEKTDLLIPKKDNHLVKTHEINKIFNFKNLFNLTLKLKNKIENKHSEYKYINIFIKRAFICYLNYKRNQSYYFNIEKIKTINKKIIFFPLHFPIDSSLTVRSPEYVDQFNFIRKFSKILSNEYILVVKEHPYSKGYLDIRKFSENIIFINPNLKFSDLKEYIYTVVTIESKFGLDAYLNNIPVILLGNPFYKNLTGIEILQTLNEDNLKIKLENIAENKKIKINNKSAINIVYGNLYHGELYDDTCKNIELVSKSILNFISE